MRKQCVPALIKPLIARHSLVDMVGRANIISRARRMALAGERKLAERIALIARYTIHVSARTLAEAL
jgi:hypothetical protein